MLFDNWNIQTQLWLRRICYDRLGKFKIAGSFMLGLIWHGVQPGFVFAYVQTPVFIIAGREVCLKLTSKMFISARLDF
jgi:hypothetical protein